jgi:hypothetical protein
MAKTQTNRVIEALVVKGQALTAKQIASRFGAANPYGLVYSLRKKGVKVDLVTTRNSRGRETSKYMYVG